VALTFPFEGVALNFFFQEEAGLYHSIHCVLVGLKAMDRIFILSDNPRQKVFTISLIAGEQI